MSYELLIILTLVFLNGLFAMAEMAIVAARKSRLEARAEAGSGNARIALQLAKEPSQLLSTVQIGITLIGIVAGVYGGATLASDLEAIIRNHLPVLGRYAYPISYAVVVFAITYLSLIVGELVPKRLALAFPENIAVALAPVLRLTLAVFNPFVLLLEGSTKTVLRFLPVRIPDEQAVTEEDVRSLIEEGAEQGVIESDESEILNRTLRLGDRPVQSIMTPRVDLVWINIEDSPEDIWAKIIAAPHSHFPVCEGNQDNFIGMLSSKNLASWQAAGRTRPLAELVQQPSKLHSGMSILDALGTFRRDKKHFAVIIDEHGTIDGLVTAHDLLEAIVGELPDDPKAKPMITELEDGALLVDGWLDIDELADRLEIPHEALAGDRSFRSVGGLLMWKLSKIPEEGDSIVLEGHCFEVMDMDGHRVDKVLVRPQVSAGSESQR